MTLVPLPPPLPLPVRNKYPMLLQLVQPEEKRADCRFVANGGVVPLISAAAATQHAATFVQGCCHRSVTDMYRAPLLQLLLHCSAALSADHLAAAAPTAPATGGAIAAAEVSTGCARANRPPSAGQLAVDDGQQAGQQHSEQPD